MYDKLNGARIHIALWRIVIAVVVVNTTGLLVIAKVLFGVATHNIVAGALLVVALVAVIVDAINEEKAEIRSLKAQGLLPKRPIVPKGR